MYANENLIIPTDEQTTKLKDFLSEIKLEMEHCSKTGRQLHRTGVEFKPIDLTRLSTQTKSSEEQNRVTKREETKCVLYVVRLSSFQPIIGHD